MAISLNQAVTFGQDLLSTINGSHVILAVAKTASNGYQIVQSDIVNKSKDPDKNEALLKELFAQFSNLHIKQRAENCYFDNGFGILINSNGIHNQRILQHLIMITYWYLYKGPLKVEIDRYFKNPKLAKDLRSQHMDRITRDTTEKSFQFHATDLGIPTSMLHITLPGNDALALYFHGPQAFLLREFLKPIDTQKYILEKGDDLDLRILFSSE